MGRGNQRFFIKKATIQCVNAQHAMPWSSSTCRGPHHAPCSSSCCSSSCLGLNTNGTSFACSRWSRILRAASAAEAIWLQLVVALQYGLCWSSLNCPKSSEVRPELKFFCEWWSYQRGRPSCTRPWSSESLGSSSLSDHQLWHPLCWRCNPLLLTVYPLPLKQYGW